MKCYDCGEDNPVIYQFLYCEVASCREEIAVMIDNEEVSYSVFCPQHRNYLTLIWKKINQWIKLIERNDDSSSDGDYGPTIEEVE